MKAILEFDLPDDAENHDHAVHATDMYVAIEDFDNQLRSWLKHGHTFKTADEALETVRLTFNDLMMDSGVRL